MAIVAGIDFGTLSVRVSLFDHERGRLGTAAAEYPLHRTHDDPHHATQRHADHLRALEMAMRAAIARSGVDGRQVEALAIDTTGSSVVPVDQHLNPIDDYYLWCDHRASKEAAEITTAARAANLEAIAWCGGTYSSEWGWAKLLHWLRANPVSQFASAFEHCDWMAATLCGIRTVEEAPRSVCAGGHKWMWNEALGGFPPEAFWVSVDPLLRGVRAKLGGRWGTSDKLAGRLCEEWARRLQLRPGIPIPIGALDAHWDAIGCGIRVGDVVNVVGTSTCIMAICDETDLIPGVSGVVKGSIHPGKYGIEAGLSAVGDTFDAIARRAGVSVEVLSKGLEDYRAGQTGLLRLVWDNGDRTVLVNPELSGVALGWRLTHTAQDELFAAIEGTAFHTRITLDRMAEHGVPIRRILHTGGIPQKNEVLNRVYANVLGKPVLVPESDVTSLGSAIMAFLAAGVFATVEEAQDALCPKYRVVEPDPVAVDVYDELFARFKALYFSTELAGALTGLGRVAR